MLIWPPPKISMTWRPTRALKMRDKNKNVYLIKGPDKPTSQLLPIITNKQGLKRYREGRKDKGGGGGSLISNRCMWKSCVWVWKSSVWKSCVWESCERVVCVCGRVVCVLWKCFFPPWVKSRPPRRRRWEQGTTPIGIQCHPAARLPRKVTRRPGRPSRTQARDQTQPSAASATPATQSDAAPRKIKADPSAPPDPAQRCHQLARLPRQTAVNVTECDASAAQSEAARRATNADPSAPPDPVWQSCVCVKDLCVWQSSVRQSCVKDSAWQSFVWQGSWVGVCESVKVCVWERKSSVCVCVTTLRVTKLCAICAWQNCVCVGWVVCDKAVCDKVEWQSCAWKIMCDKVVCERLLYEKVA